MVWTYRRALVLRVRPWLRWGRPDLRSTRTRTPLGATTDGAIRSKGGRDGMFGSQTSRERREAVYEARRAAQ
jgi:hypothetical protein